MKKFLSGIFAVYLFFFFFPKITFADVPNPSYLNAKCNPDEIEVICRWGRDSLGSPVKSECARYENNPNYRFLDGTGSTFGGSREFCFKAVSTSDFIIYHFKAVLMLLFITLLFEIPIFLILVSKNRRALQAVLSANLISVLLFYFITVILSLSGLVMLIVMELVVIIFEALFIKLILNEIGFGKILRYSIIANMASAILGSVLLYYING